MAAHLNPRVSVAGEADCVAAFARAPVALEDAWSSPPTANSCIYAIYAGSWDR